MQRCARVVYLREGDGRGRCAMRLCARPVVLRQGEGGVQYVCLHRPVVYKYDRGRSLVERDKGDPLCVRLVGGG